MYSIKRAASGEVVVTAPDRQEFRPSCGEDLFLAYSYELHKPFRSESASKAHVQHLLKDVCDGLLPINRMKIAASGGFQTMV